MSRSFFMIFFILGCVSSSFSQNTLNDYQYVVVPTQYNFLSEKDQFQLNSLSKFLFNKYGFNAYFTNEIPDEFKRCDGLWSDLEKSSGFIYTNISVILNDCDGNEVYRTKIGKSKFKEYKKAYQEAVRNSFKSFMSLNIDQSKKQIINENISEGSSKDNKLKRTVVVATGDVSNKTTTLKKSTALNVVVSTDYSINKTKNDPNTFSYSNESYLIIPFEKGYTLLFEGVKIGTLKPTTINNVFLVSTEQFNGVAYKTNVGFVVEREVEGVEELVIMNFKITKE